MTIPSWDLMMSTVSSTERPLGTLSLRKSPMISPSAVLTSSPTMSSMSSNFLAYLAPLNAPAVSSWSVMAMTSYPSDLILSTWVSGDMTDSGNFMLLPSCEYPE